MEIPAGIYEISVIFGGGHIDTGLVTKLFWIRWYLQSVLLTFDCPDGGIGAKGGVRNKISVDHLH